MTITKKKITKILTEKLNLSFDNSSDILETFLFLIKFNSKNQTVKINGFGTFGTKKTTQRIGRNPKTKESYIISSFKKPVFKASNKIKEILNWTNFFS